MATLKRRWYQFSLRSLFVVITVLSVGPLPAVWWLRTQMEGELLTEQEADIDVGTGPMPTLCFSCATAEDASDLAEQFDKEAFYASVQKSLPEADKDTPLSIYYGRYGDFVFITYDFNRWGRYRLELPSCRYRFDLSDPVADKRNADSRQSVIDVGRSYAASHSKVVKFEHSP